ncbi:GNAT family N-acetyltransferase [Aestuariispira insulae]|uniref:RimJ/RimL family protein N-acetyltransferase n=1 Tax=Aestuariispira insulae TaxID=1461337 RepID=A0A3D9HWQ9_9PROT|nr:GNAT family N-acetyltransferase [Aestuariispira insulae]RED53849.1 RimJ/RimL family protein N-acetyltransferase [Aestuariispira insulae]
MTIAYPEFETERLNLRLLGEEDAAFLLELWNDPGFIKNIRDKKIRTLDQALEEVRNVILPGHETNGFGMYRISRKGDDTPIGVCGLVKRDNFENADLGYAFLPDYLGMGYAAEAAAYVLDEARDRLGMNRVVGIVSPDNEPSIRLLEKCGFIFERMFVYEEGEEPIRFYGLAL